METIKIYNSSSQSSDGGAEKGTYSNPYTKEEFENMLDAGTWKGGYVSGYGYVGPNVDIWGSSDSFSGSESDSDSWNDSWWFDSWGSTDEGSSSDPSGVGSSGGGGGNTGGGGCQGGGNRPGTGGNSGGNTLDFPTPPSTLNMSAGVRIYSKRLFKTKNSTLSFFTAVAYDENGKIISKTKIKGRFLERVIDYDKATVANSNTAILKGEYKIIPSVNGQKYDWYLQDVPGRAGIAIHSGNYYSDSKGCLLPGEEYMNDYKNDAYIVLHSRIKLDELSELFKTYGKKQYCYNNNRSFLIIFHCCRNQDIPRILFVFCNNFQSI